MDADRLNRLRAAKLRALASTGWDIPADAAESTFPAGAVLRSASTIWALIEEDAVRRLGALLAVAVRAGADEVHAIVGDPAEAGVLARRAGLFRLRVHVWNISGKELHVAVADPPAVDSAPRADAELYRPIIVDAGLEPVVEGGFLLGELRGLEVARVVTDETTGRARLDSGVGRFDREAGAMMRAGMAEVESLAAVIDIVEPLRRGDVDRHPMNQLVRERWLRSVLASHPDLVGLTDLRPVGSAVPRANLNEDGVATAVGTDHEGRTVVVSASTGVNLDFVPTAADDRLTHAPDARLLLVASESDSAKVTEDLALLLVQPAELLTVPDDWAARFCDPLPGRSG
ncbi:MAG: hypothetical protein KDB02_14400 [Acidimicrobiales bacterium]|nr:hypothetical protein [Acidimicrobiales bacterium]